jgi:hypothetical protein
MKSFEPLHPSCWCALCNLKSSLVTVQIPWGKKKYFRICKKTVTIAKRLIEKQELRGVTLNSFLNEETNPRMKVVTYSQNLTYLNWARDQCNGYTHPGKNPKNQYLALIMFIR